MNNLSVTIVRNSNENIERESRGIRTKTDSAFFFHREKMNKQETQKQKNKPKPTDEFQSIIYSPMP
jgi:malic enzyme